MNFRYQTFVSQVDAIDLDFGRFLVEQIVKLCLVELTDRFAKVEEATAAEDAAVPAVHAVAGDLSAPSLSDLLSS